MRSLIDIISSLTFISDAVVGGGIHSLTEKEQKLLTELIALNKRYPVIVHFSGRRSKKDLLPLMIYDHCMAKDLDAIVPLAHVTVTSLKQLLNGQCQENLMWCLDGYDRIDFPELLL